MDDFSYIQEIASYYKAHIKPILDGMSDGEATLFGVFVTTLLGGLVWLVKTAIQRLLAKKNKPEFHITDNTTQKEPSQSENTLTHQDQAPITDPQAKYDIFISYRSTQLAWVEVLAHNLKQQGYTVFLDVWELYGGQQFSEKIFAALDNSRCALLLATPEATDSGWVQEEYEYMQNLSEKRQDFHWIPLVLGQFPDFPFLSNIHAVNFADSQPEQYRRAFQYLLCAIQQKPPGSQPYFAGQLKLPNTEPDDIRPLVATERSFVDAIFSYLESSMPVMLLAQSGNNTQHYAQAIKHSAQDRYGKANVLHIFPPASSRADTADCFSRMAKQCNFDENIQESWEWADALRDQIKQGQQTLLLVTGFENGSSTARAELAAELRGLLEEHPFELKLVLIGGNRLAEMKYKDGKMSLLNTLTEMRLPETSLQDMREIYLQRYPQLQIGDNELQAMLDFTGKHPRLLEASLQAKQANEDWKSKLKNGYLPSQLFTRFRNEEDHEALCRLLNNQQLGRYDAWPQDKLLRRLYWANLISHAEGQFVWRGEFIRKTGVELLGC